METLLICVSVSNGNTRRVADRMADVLGTEVVELEAVNVERLGDYDLISFGPGIYFMAVHPRLRRLIRRLPRGDGIRAFTFFTSGRGALPRLGYRRAVHRQLASKGFEVLDSFLCRGLDTVGPLRLVGGVNKGRPNDADLDRAAVFATQLRERVEQSPNALRHVPH